MTYVAENPRYLPSDWKDGRSLALEMMARSEPAQPARRERPLSASERAARLAAITRARTALR